MDIVVLLILYPIDIDVAEGHASARAQSDAVRQFTPLPTASPVCRGPSGHCIL